MQHPASQHPPDITGQPPEGRPGGGRLSFLPAVMLVFLLLPACIASTSYLGYRLDERMLGEIRVGESTREDVRKLLGSPTTASPFPGIGESWYYVGKSVRKISFLSEEVLEQDVVAISFDQESGTVSGIRRLDLDDAMTITPDPEVTPSPGSDVNAITEILRNIGRFNVPKDQRSPNL